MIRERRSPWQVAMMMMLTTCGLLACRPALTDERAPTSVDSAKKPPNIVLIMADDKH